MHDLPPSAMTE